jgi:cell division protein FtsB
LCVVCTEKRRWLTLCLVQSLACVEEAEGRLAAPKAADEALVQRHTELVKEAEALRASLTEREERIKFLETEAAAAKKAAEASSSLLEEEKNKQAALRENERAV